MGFIQFSTGCDDLRKDGGVQIKVIAWQPVRRECRDRFGTDVDSFDTVIRQWQLTLKTKGIIHRWFGISIALFLNGEQ